MKHGIPINWNLHKPEHQTHFTLTHHVTLLESINEKMKQTATSKITTTKPAIRLGFVIALVLCLFLFTETTERSISIADNHTSGSTLSIDGIIHPISAGFLERGIRKAIEQGSQLIVVRLNTPGGLLDSTRQIVNSINESSIPVVVYVSPSGAQAASAGTFITVAAHIAAMAPGTNIGAATPVGSQGEDLPETLKSKATQDAAAFIRSIADQRDRNADALQDTVLRAVSFSSREAVHNNIVDIIAKDESDLLDQIDGRSVDLGGRQVVINTDDMNLTPIGRTLLERFLGIVANPNIAFILLSLGGVGLLIELLNPGVIIPGLVGAIALSLALIGMGNLPVNWVGVALMGIAMALFFMEIQAPGVGVLAVCGAVSFVTGAFLLFGGLNPSPILAPSFRVSMWIIGTVSAVLFISIGLIYRIVRSSKQETYISGKVGVVGKIGTTASELNPRGTVRIASELWTAEAESQKSIKENEKIIVTSIEGLTLTVQKITEEPPKEVGK